MLCKAVCVFVVVVVGLCALFVAAPDAASYFLCTISLVRSKHGRSLHHLTPAAGGGWTSGTIANAIPKIVGFAEDHEVGLGHS